MKAQTWFLLVFDLPRAKNTERVKMYRLISSSNLLKFQDSVYALPATPENELMMNNIATALMELGANVMVFTAGSYKIMSKESETDLFEICGAGLDSKYTELFEKAKELNAKVNKAKTPAEQKGLIRSLNLIQKKYQNMAKNDYREAVSTIRGKLELEITDVRNRIVKIQ